MGVGLVLRVGVVIIRALTAHKVSAECEHIIRIRHSRSAPAIAHMDSPQIAAVPKHVNHITHLGRIETAQVKTGQSTTIKKHAIHFDHFGRIEVAHINARQLITFQKHKRHIGNFAGVQVTQALNSLKFQH